MFTITFQPVGRRVDIQAGQNLMQAATSLAFSGENSVEAPCGGQGLCGQCRVRILSGDVSPATESETNLLSESERTEGVRLACQAVPLSDLTVEIPPESLSGKANLQLAGTVSETVADPLVDRYDTCLKPASAGHPKSVWQQVEKLLVETHHIESPRFDPWLIAATDPEVHTDQATVSLIGNEVINIHFSLPCPPPVGLAVDLGTTKVAGYLLDLESGRILASEGILNPQMRFGEDVISRITHAMRGENQADQLAQITRKGLGHLAKRLAEAAGLDTGDIEQAVIAGNTAMAHLLLRWPVEQLGHSPYVPASTAAVDIKARQLDMDFAPGATVYLLPAVAGFVGGDHTAMILGSGIQYSETTTLGLDIGTNTEIVLACNGKLTSCSCASGPAFEGAQISHGMRAVDGAVSKVDIDAQGLLQWQTIGAKAPIGICGSGVLDAIAALVLQGTIGPSGILDRNNPKTRPCQNSRAMEYVLVPADKTGIGRDLVLTQKDVSAIQLAKAAIASGVKLLLDQNGIGIDQIDHVVVAGAFGTHLRLQSAIVLGLLPALPLERFVQVGNAAGTGARMALISKAKRGEVEQLARRVQYLELASRPDFGEVFADSLYFHRMN